MKLIDAVLIRLRNIMDERHIKPNYFHTQGGVAKSTIWQLFHNRQQTVSLDLLYQLTSTLNISLHEFFDDKIFDEVTD